MDLGLKGRRALVTGASSGIGKAIAAALAAEGARVAICARTEHRLRKAAVEIRAVTKFTCDLSLPGAGQAAAAEAADLLGGLDILVANTGGPPAGPFLDLSTEHWQTGFASLWMSAVDLIRTALPAMRQQRWGRIIVVTSIAGREPLAGLTVSSSLRAGLHGLINSISREVAADGVTLNALMPGYTRTEQMAALGLDDELLAQIPAGRMADPAEIGHLAAFLASARAGYMTGQAIAIDGGFLRSI